MKDNMLEILTLNRNLLESLIRWLPFSAVKQLTLVNKTVCKRVKTVMFDMGSHKVRDRMGHYWIKTSKIESPADVDQFHRNKVKNLIIDDDVLDIYRVFTNLKRMYVYEAKQPIDFPSTLNELLMVNYLHPILVLPPKLKDLYLSRDCKYPLSRDIIPDTLEYFSVNVYPYEVTPFLPSGLKHLYFTCGYKENINLEKLPRNLISLRLPKLSPHATDHAKLPLYLKHLEMTGLNEIEPNKLPIHLNTLCIYKYRFNIIPNTLPSNLKKLSIYGFRGKILPESIPASVTHISIDWNDTNPDLIPDTVTHLDLTWKYKEGYTAKNFPRNIKRLLVSTNLHDDITKGVLPKTNTLCISGFGLIEDGALNKTECQNLSFSGYCRTVTDLIIPDSVRKLRLPYTRKGRVNIKEFPPHLEVLGLKPDSPFKLPVLDGIKVVHAYSLSM